MADREGKLPPHDLLSAEPRRLRWDFSQSPWNAGTLIVEYSAGHVTCYAPPGASLRGEQGADLACWRRAAWSKESLFFERRDPDWLERLSTARTRELLPFDFHEWAAQATASHLARLRTLQTLCDDARAVEGASTALLLDLDRGFPHAYERYSCAREDASVAQWRRLADDRTREASDARASEGFLDPWTMRRRDWAAFLSQFLWLGVVYLAYRLLLRPDLVAESPPVRLATVLQSSPRDVLLWSYGLAHVPLTLGFLLWVYFRRHTAFVFVRNTVLVGAVLAVAASRVERVLSGVPVYSSGVQDTVPPIALPILPLMHLATAVLLGACGVILTRSRLTQLLWLAYPLVVAAVIVASPPTWLLPTLCAGVLLSGLAWALARFVAGHLRRGWATPPEVAGHLEALESKLVHPVRTLGVLMPVLRSRA